MDIEELAGELNRLGEQVIFLGDGAEVYRERLEERLRILHQWAPPHLSCQRAGAVAALGGQLFLEGKCQSAAEHTPVYLRMPQAERERMART